MRVRGMYVKSTAVNGKSMVGLIDPVSRLTLASREYQKDDRGCLSVLRSQPVQLDCKK